MSFEEGEFVNMSMSERIDLMSRQLDNQRLRIDELEDQVKILKNKEAVVLQLVSLDAAKMMIQQQLEQQQPPRGASPHQSRGRRRSRSPSPVVAEPVRRLRSVERRRSPPVVISERRRSVERRRSPAGRRSRSPPVSKKRHLSPNRSVHVSQLHHLNVDGRVALTEALYRFFGSYGQVDDVYLADNEKWAKITFSNLDDAATFFNSHHNSSDTVKCAPFISGGAANRR